MTPIVKKKQIWGIIFLDFCNSIYMLVLMLATITCRLATRIRWFGLFCRPPVTATRSKQSAVNQHASSHHIIGVISPDSLKDSIRPPLNCDLPTGIFNGRCYFPQGTSDTRRCVRRVGRAPSPTAALGSVKKEPG